MAINVHRHLDARMPKPFLHDFGVHPLLEKKRRVRMAQTVEGKALPDMTLFQQGLKIPSVEIGGADGAAERACEQ